MLRNVYDFFSVYCFISLRLSTSAVRCNTVAAFKFLFLFPNIREKKKINIAYVNTFPTFYFISMWMCALFVVVKQSLRIVYTRFTQWRYAFYYGTIEHLTQTHSTDQLCVFVVVFFAPDMHVKRTNVLLFVCHFLSSIPFVHTSHLYIYVRLYNDHLFIRMCAYSFYVHSFNQLYLGLTCRCYLRFWFHFSVFKRFYFHRANFNMLSLYINCFFLLCVTNSVRYINLDHGRCGGFEVSEKIF